MAPKLFICLLPPHWHSLYPTHIDLHNFDSPNDGKFFISYTFIIYFHLLPLPQHLSWFHLPTHRLACPCWPPRRQWPKRVLFGPGKFCISFIYFCLLPLPQHLSWFHLPTHRLACPCQPPWRQWPKRVLFGPGKFFISFTFIIYSLITSATAPFMIPPTNTPSSLPMSTSTTSMAQTSVVWAW